jgi:deazaflavin-dependent oxidoreductase (nitroreductase family)
MAAVLLGLKPGRPNPVQRVVRWASGTRVGAWLLALTLRRVDTATLALTGGRRTFTSIATGLPIVALRTTGARTGRPRRSFVLGIPLGADLAVAGGNFGHGEVPAWARNLAAHPDAQVEFGGRTAAVVARPANTGETAFAVNAATAILKPFGAYARRASRRGLPVLILELAEDEGTPSA